jgi:hypothetical protein
VEEGEEEGDHVGRELLVKGEVEEDGAELGAGGLVAGAVLGV